MKASSNSTGLSVCIRYLLFMFFYFVLNISCNGYLPDGDIINFSGSWELVPTDDKDALSRFSDNKSTITVSIPGAWNTILEKNKDRTAIVWLRKIVHNAKFIKGESYILSLGRIGVADETYFNGTLIGSCGRFPVRGDNLRYRSGWQIPRNYFVSQNLINHNGENVITIRIFSHVISGINGVPQLMPEKQWKENSTVLGFPLISLIHVSLLVCNIIFFIIFINIYLGDRKRLESLLLLLLISGSIIVHLLILGIAPVVDGFLILKIMFGLYTSAFLLFARIAELYFKVRIKYVWPMSVILFIVILFFIIFMPTTEFFIKYTGILHVLINTAYHIYVPGLLIVMIVRDPVRYWYLSIVSFIALLMDLYYLYCLINMQLFNLPFHISQVSIFLFLGLIIFISEYNEMQKENTTIAKLLLRKGRELQKLDRLYASTTTKKFRPEPREAINDVIEYLDGHYFEHYDRKALADRFKIKEDYMCQIFKKKTDTTISNYINTLRIDAVKKMLEDTDSRIIDIAFHVGFDNLTHFHRLFKKITGLTPKRYRENRRRFSDE